METRILVYLVGNRTDPSAPMSGDVAILSDNPKVQEDICDLGGDLVFLLSDFPAQSGLWWWVGRLVEGTECENYQLEAWQRLTAAELGRLSCGLPWEARCA